MTQKQRSSTRRRVLTVAGSTALLNLAGCLGGGSNDPESTETMEDEMTDGEMTDGEMTDGEVAENETMEAR